MKLNPPETAPRDATEIIVCLHGTHLFHAVWNVSNEVWLLASCTAAGHITMCPVSDKDVTGWLPMPQIDNEGNVTWPTASPE